MTSSPTNFEPYHLEPAPKEEDFVSSGNVVRTDKTLVIKDQVIVNDVETLIKQGQKIKVSRANSVYTALLTDYLISVPSVAVAPTISLPKAATAGLGKIYVIKDASGSALSTTITITPNGTETIDGDTTNVLATNFGKVRLYSDGSNWFSF